MSGTEPLPAGVRAELDGRIAALREAVAEGDLDLLHRRAHQLKGSALALGLDDLAVAMVAAEHAVDDASVARALATAAHALALHDAESRLRTLRHDLRNDLGVMLMAAGLLELDVEEGSSAAERAQMIATAAAAASAKVEAIRVLPEGAATPAAVGAPPTSVATIGARVLLVDDDRQVASLTGGALTAAGVEVVVVGDLGAARAALADGAFSAALVDLAVGPESGTELLPDLRAHGIRALAYTGEDTGLVSAGWDGVVSKSDPVATLLAALGLVA